MIEPVYLDNAATTPVSDSVVAAMEPFARNTFGNPSSPHRFGRAARAALDAARRTLAEIFGIEPAGVIFTSGGTESDNLAVIGGAIAARRNGKEFSVAVPSTEHKAVLGAAGAVERMGGRCLRIEVTGAGQVDADSLERILAAGPGLVSVMWVNNETGALQDVRSLAERCAARGTKFHTDAVQAVGKVVISQDVPFDLLSISGHKIHGPKGTGVLLVRDLNDLDPLTRGGGQQRGMRSGTENVAGIVGMTAAIEQACASLDTTSAHMANLRDDLETRLTQTITGITVNATEGPRAPHVSNMSIDDTDSESMLMHLDLEGVACSSGSACDSGTVEPSYVLKAMGVDERRATSALRFSFSSETGAEAVDRVVEVMPAVVERVRSLNAALGR